MSSSFQKLSSMEKIGYGLGDAAANLVWRGAMFFLAFFYTDVYGLEALAVGALMLIVRMSDGVTDIIMGMVADRSNSRWGKFRPWIIFTAPALGLCMVLTYSTPDLSPAWALVYAYATYIALTLVYTMNNVPYSALMGVMTPSHVERTQLSGWRFAGAFLGGFIVAVGAPVMISVLGGDENPKQGYQYTMIIFALILVSFLCITFFTTRERVKPAEETAEKTNWANFALTMLVVSIPLLSISLFFYYQNIPTGLFFALVVIVSTIVIRKKISQPREELSDEQRDIVDLLTNRPWLILLGVGFLFMMFTGIKSAATAYYFIHYLSDGITLNNTFTWAPAWLANINPDSALLSAYLGGTMLISVIGALMTGFLVQFIGKRELFIGSLILSSLISCGVWFLGPDDVAPLFALGISAELFAAVWPVLFFSMLGDSADYSEWKNKRRATGLVYSAGTFINKTGGGFAAALVVMVLSSYGYIGTDPSTIPLAFPGMKALMSWIPGVFALTAAVLLMLYPLTRKKMADMEVELTAHRAAAA